jgi:hypothetical protein
MRFFVALTISLIITPFSWSSEYQFHPDPQAYVLNKIKTHDITFFGTKHRRDPILNLVSSLIPELHKVGVTHILFEIASDQQSKVDHFLETGDGLEDVKIWPSIDCPEYWNLFNVVKNLPPAEKIIPVCIDLPMAKLGGDINRDQWMAQSISKIFHDNPNAKVFVKIGNTHTLKKFDWQDHVPNKRVSLREELIKLLPSARVFSITNIIDQNPDKCDFTKAFGSIPDTVAIDCDERFSGWKAGFQHIVAINPSEVCDLVDGFIIYSKPNFNGKTS